MVVVSIGLPGRFADWCDAVILSLAERAVGPIAMTSGNTAEELAFALFRTEVRHFFISSRQPGEWLYRVLGEFEKPFVIALDDPQVAVADLVGDRRLDWIDATRRVACASASMAKYLELPRALVVRADRDVRNPHATAAAMARHLGIPVAAHDIDDTLAELTAGVLRRSPLEGIPDGAVPAINGALMPYKEHFRGTSLEEIVWMRDLFLRDGNQSALEAVDITGRSRCLIYGPYITLPPGSWTAEVLLGFSQEATDMNFLIDVFAGSQLTFLSFRPPRPGVFPVTLGFEVPSSNNQLLEIRVVNQRAAFDGKLVLEQVSLRSHRSIPTATLDRLTAQLGLPH